MNIFVLVLIFVHTQYESFHRIYVPVQDTHGYKWILTVVDHFTKYLWAAAFKTKEAPPIAKFLLNTFRDGVCFPERWHADNGGEFKNFYIDAVRELLSANGESRKAEGLLLPYSHSMPRNPQCQGLVERGNRTLKSGMARMTAAAGYDSTLHDTWEWRPVLANQVRELNRKIISMYRCMSVQTPTCPTYVDVLLCTHPPALLTKSEPTFTPSHSVVCVQIFSVCDDDGTATGGSRPRTVDSF